MCQALHIVSVTWPVLTVLFLSQTPSRLYHLQRRNDPLVQLLALFTSWQVRGVGVCVQWGRCVCVVGSVGVCGGVCGGVSGGVVVYLCVAKRAKVTAYAAKIGICCSVSLTLQSIIVFIICGFICTYNYTIVHMLYMCGVFVHTYHFHFFDSQHQCKIIVSEPVASAFLYSPPLLSSSPSPPPLLLHLLPPPPPPPPSRTLPVSGDREAESGGAEWACSVGGEGLWCHPFY